MEILDVVFVYELSGWQLIRWHSRRHAHVGNQYELHYFLGGDGMFTNGDEQHDIAPGQLFLSYPEQVHEIHPTGDPITYYAILFDIGEDKLLCSGLNLVAQQAVLPWLIGEKQRTFFEDIKCGYNRSIEYKRLAEQHRLKAFLFDLISSASVDDHHRERGGYNIHVEQALGLFQRYVFERRTLRDVCDELEITEEYLIRIFRKRMGMTPMKYYQMLKMEAATSLLLNTSQSVKEIAWELGFASQYHFSRNFKAFSGSSPSEYRRNYFSNNPTEYHIKILKRGD